MTQTKMKKKTKKINDIAQEQETKKKGGKKMKKTRSLVNSRFFPRPINTKGLTPIEFSMRPTLPKKYHVNDAI